MDSLLANYASSDEEEQEQEERQQNGISKPPFKFSEPSSLGSSSSQSKFSSSFLSLPPPKSQFLNFQTPQNRPLSHAHKSDDFEDEDIKPTCFFSSLPELKTHPSNARMEQHPSPLDTNNINYEEDKKIVPKTSLLFSLLPKPKSHLSSPLTTTNITSSDPKPKRVVQFMPPINPYAINSSDDDEDEGEDKENERKRKQLEPSTQISAKSFLASIPAPRNSATLGALVSSLGSGRRSVIEADVPALSARVKLEPSTQTSSANSFASSIPASVNSATFGALSSLGAGQSSIIEADVPVSNAGYSVGIGSSSASLDGQLGSVMSGSDPSNWVQGGENYGSYEDYVSHGYNTYESKWVDKSTTLAMPETLGMTESVMRLPRKKGRNDIPTEIVEVKQDELIKNRPREDQVKLTGIAFGPSYQPVSTKGKPSKLHKRKHQIGSLYFDMKQKEMELAERRSRGFLTKAETQAKYGW